MTSGCNIGQPSSRVTEPLSLSCLQDYQLIISQACHEFWVGRWVKACCLATDTLLPPGSWKPPLLRWVSSAGASKCFSPLYCSLPCGPGSPGLRPCSGQGLAWARCPSLEDVYAASPHPAAPQETDRWIG